MSDDLIRRIYWYETAAWREEHGLPPLAETKAAATQEQRTAEADVVSATPAPAAAQNETPRMTLACRGARGIEEGCKLERELAACQAKLAAAETDRDELRLDYQRVYSYAREHGLRMDFPL